MENEELMVEEPENVVEQPTEEVVEGAETEEIEVSQEKLEKENEQDEKTKEKMYTEEEFNKKLEEMLNSKLDEVLPKKIARKEAKIKREYERKYGGLERTLQAGLGTNDIEETNARLSEFYKEQGVQIPNEPEYSKRDLEILAKAEANSIIDAGYDDIVDEVNFLASKGIENMTAREKIIFKQLAEERKKQEEVKELVSIGVTEQELNDKEFKEFASKLNPELSTKEKYEFYQKLNPKEAPAPIGSMKNTGKKEEKTSYTPEEVDKLTAKDLDNPKIFANVRKSMLSWGKK